MKIQITADNTLDINKECLNKYDIKTFGLAVQIGENEYIDGENINGEQIFEAVKKTNVLPKTSARSQEEYRVFFEQFTKQGCAVIHFSLGSGFSASHKNALEASKQLENVYVVDSNNLSSATGLLTIYASELASEGKTPQQIVDMCTKRVDSLQASFVIDNLKYLHKGGRCSTIALLGANLLKLKPTIIVKNGKMTVGKKYRGLLTKAIEQYVEDILNTFNTPDYTRVCITYSSKTDEMVEVTKSALQKHAKFKEILINTAGATIASHCGPMTLGILYFNDGNKND